MHLYSNVFWGTRGEEGELHTSNVQYFTFVHPHILGSNNYSKLLAGSFLTKLVLIYLFVLKHHQT